MCFFNSALIHGEFFSRKHLVQVGACLSAICKKFDFHSDHIWSGLEVENKNSQFPARMSLRKLARLKFLKFLNVLELCPFGKSIETLRIT